MLKKKVIFLGVFEAPACMWFSTFQLLYNSNNLDTTQDMYKFIDKMSNGNVLQELTCWAASFWNLLGLRACLQFGQSPCHPIKNSQECHVTETEPHTHRLWSTSFRLVVTWLTDLSWLACTEFRLVPYYPACDLRTLGLTYITLQSSLHSVPYTDIGEFKVRRPRTTNHGWTSVVLCL